VNFSEGLSMDAIARHYKDAQNRYARSNPAMLKRVKASWVVFDKYYQKIYSIPAYTAALILHPARRTQYYPEELEERMAGAWPHKCEGALGDLPS
jgi:hypothetical protein